MDKQYATGVSATFHYEKVDEVKVGMVESTNGVWFEIDSGLVNVTMFYRNDDHDLGKSFDLAFDTLDRIKAKLKNLETRRR